MTNKVDLNVHRLSHAFHLGISLLQANRLEEAAKELTPLVTAGYKSAMLPLAHCRVGQGRLLEAIELFDRAKSPSDVLFYSLHLDDEVLVSGLHDTWAKIHFPQGVRSVKARPWSKPWEKIRVAYIGAEVGTIGTVKRFLDPVIAHHDLSRIQVELYDEGVSAQDITRDKTDVVVDLLGHMAGGVNIGVIGDCDAPLICNYIGYPHPTGIPWQHRITSDRCDPFSPDGSSPEKLIRLSGCPWAYSPNGNVDVTPPPYDKNGYVTFGSLNRECKITPEVAKTWGRIMAEMPEARLIVLAKGSELNIDIRALLQNNGVPGDRLTLAPTGDRRHYLNLTGQIDIALDPWPYNGMTTTCDLLWEGIPVIALEGKHHRSRVSSGILMTGLSGSLPSTVTDDIAYYVKCAKFWAINHQYRTFTRRGLREIMRNSPLCDGERVANNLEDAWYDERKRASSF